MPMDTMNLNLKVINEVKNNGRLLSDVAKDYGLSTKTVYQIINENERGSKTSSLPIMQQTKQLALRIKQLLGRR
ncbi:transposase IS3/IS911 family protein [Shewanella halifaxensis HAW-EB4]|uniref:Transposase IS3/IS911 family protein n=2 Tax=Shewanella halifaxensis TaxID=271098 RepID=B0TUY6_SHEHH|nr:transposase IS3/IS911 family protein [Shewanella halifaxensis HAW-EB4]